MVIKLSTLNKGLVAHYPLDEASLKSSVILGDKTPNNNDGISANTPNFVSDRFGHTRAMSFNGSTDYIDCGNDASLTMAVNDFTVVGWININDISTHCLVSNRGSGGPGTNPGWGIRINSSNKIAIELDDGNVATSWAGIEIGNTFINNGIWYQVAVVFDRDALATAYINGCSDGSLNISTGGDITTAVNVYLGQGGNLTYKTTGSLADVRIYNRAITPAEVELLFQQYRSKISMGSLMKGLVLDLPLTSQRYNAGNSKFDDLTPYENRGTNSGATIGADYTSFNGTSDHIRIADSESLSPTSVMSAMAWVKGGAQNNKGILSHYDIGASQRAFLLSSSSNSPYNAFRITISDNGIYINHVKTYQSSITAFDNTWHQIGFTFNAGTLKLFVDGVEDTNPTKTDDDAITTIHNSTADVMSGCYLNNNTPTTFFNGDIAKARMYNRALTAAEWVLQFEKQKGAFL